MTEHRAETLLISCRGETLVGILHVPQQQAADLGVVIVVGGPQYRVGSHRQFVIAARALAASGYPVLRFDYRGMGDNAAGLQDFEKADEDIRAAVDALLASAPGVRRVVLFGLCDAASAVLMYVTGDRRIAGLVILNPWVRTQATQAQTYLRHYYVQRFLQPSFWRRVFSARFAPGKAARELWGSLRQAGGRGRTDGPSSTHFLERMLAGLEGFSGEVLLLISEQDLTAKEFLQLCQSDARWRSALRGPRVRRVELSEADHTFSTRADLDGANRHCLDWLREVRGS